MGMPYRARVNERTLLNLPGFHDGAFVYVYVEDTSERELRRRPRAGRLQGVPVQLRAAQTRDRRLHARIALEFDIESSEGRDNSLHKLDTLVSALRLFREALVSEFEPYDRRARELEAMKQEKPGPAGRRRAPGHHADVAEPGRRARLRSGWGNPWGFDSLHPHSNTDRRRHP